MMAIPGHTIIMAILERKQSCRITLECTCGRVLHAAEFVVDDLKHRQIVSDEGHAKAVEHLNVERGVRNAERENPS